MPNEGSQSEPAHSVGPVTKTPRPGSAWLLGLLLVLLGIPIYFLGFSVPFLRATGAATFAAMALGVFVSLSALSRDRRWRARIAAAFSVLLTGVSAAMFFVVTRLPHAGAAVEMTTAGDFTLPDEHGKPRTLSDLCKAGPVLLVFYRGHW